MRRFYRLNDDVHIEGRSFHSWARFADGSERLPDGSVLCLASGIRYDNAVPPIIPVCEAGVPLEFSTSSFAVPIVSRRLAIAMKELAKDDLQIVEVVIPEEPDNVVINPLRVIQCVDEARSEFIKWTEHDHRSDLAGQYRSLMKPVLLNRAIPADVHIFRIWGSLVELVVSDTMKGTMEQTGCFGATFTEIEVS